MGCRSATTGALQSANIDSANEVSIYNSNGTLRANYAGVQSPDELVVFAPVRDNPNPNPAPEPRTLTLLVAAGLGLLWGRGSRGGANRR
jgi:hypothetical protein